MSPPFSRYIDDITAFGLQLKAEAVYCFIIGGSKGTGGSPLVLRDALDRVKYRRYCEELVLMMRRSADLLEADLARQGFGGNR